MLRSSKFTNVDFYNENPKSFSKFNRPFMAMRTGVMNETTLMTENAFASPVFQSTTNTSFTSGGKTYHDHFSSKHSSRHNSSDEEFTSFESKSKSF